MSHVATPKARAFDRAFGLIVEGACPADGDQLERREGWGYAFCATCGEGWQAGTGYARFIHRASDEVMWGEDGRGWASKVERSSCGLPRHVRYVSAEDLPTAGVSG